MSKGALGRVLMLRSPALQAEPLWRVAALAVLALALALLSVQSAAAQSPTTLTLTVAENSVSEDVGTVTVTATLDQPAPAGGVQVTLTSRPLAGRAQVGSDFSLPSAFTIAEGDTVGTADVTILDNPAVEPDKPVVLNATVNVDNITVNGVTFTLTDDDVPRLTGIHVLIGSDIAEDASFGRLPKLQLTPSFDGLTTEFEARANPAIEDVTLFVTGGVDRGSITMGLQGSLEQPNVIRYGNALSQPITLADGENVIKVQRTQYDKTSTYTVTVTRGLLPAPGFSVTRGARNGGPAITVALAVQPLSTQEMRVQVRESTSDPWPDAATSNLLPAGASASPYTWTFNDITLTGLGKGTDYEVRAHLVELSGSVTDLTRTVISRSGSEKQVTTLSPAPAPTGLTLTPTEPGTGLTAAILARWSAVENAGQVWYRVRWREADQTPEAAWSGPRQASRTSYSVGPLEDGTYDVQVASDNGVNPIAWSEIKQATVNHAGGV